MKLNRLLAGTLAFVLVAGLGTPAFAGEMPFDGEDNTVWVDCFVVAGQSGDCSLDTGPSEFNLAPVFATWNCETLSVPLDSNNGLESDCVVTVPNYIDPLPLKLIHITTDFAVVDDVLCFNDVEFPGPPPQGESGIRDSTSPNSPDGVIEEWRCEPNPDVENIFFTLTSNEVSNIEIHTVSKDVPPPPPVGGEFLPIDSTALVLAGLQTSAIWMLPVLAGIAGSAFGILYIKYRRN